MRRFAAALALAALAQLPAGCRKAPEGTLEVLVIGDAPKLVDPAQGPLTTSDEVLLGNSAQGLVAFDAAGNIVGGLAERWTVTDDGLSYIFRLSSAQWPDGRKVTADQVARILKRQIASRSRNNLKDRLGAVDDILAMTDRVLEIRLVAPRPELLSILAEPEMAIVRDRGGTGPFRAAPKANASGFELSRDIVSPDEETTWREKLFLAGAPAPTAIDAFISGKADLVLGGTFGDLSLAQKAALPRGALRFDPASGLFGLVPTHADGPLEKTEVRQLLSEAIDRDAFVTALAVPNLSARATVLEAGLEGVAAPAPPAWSSSAYADRLPALRAQAKRLFTGAEKPVIKVALPDSPGGALLLRLLQGSWANVGVSVEKAERPAQADFTLIDDVAPSAGAAWFVRRFRCEEVAVCDPKADALMDEARAAEAPAQRYALLAQAAALIDSESLFIPITAPVRWSLVSPRIQNFAGNRYALHTLTNLETPPGSGE